MGMPQLPKRENPPCLVDAVIQIVESVGIEELAMAHILNAEGERLQAVVKQYRDGCICSCFLNESVEETHNIINTLIMKEYLMINKLNTALKIYNSL